MTSKSPAPPVVLLGRDHPDKSASTVRAVAPGLACALAAGEGPSRNPKAQPNEDSLAAFALPRGGLAAIVADSHFGGRAGEALVTALTEVLDDPATAPPATHDELADLVAAVNQRVGAAAAPDDASESTLLVALARAGRLDWVSFGDSLLYVVAREGDGVTIALVNAPRSVFAGGHHAARTPPGAYREVGWLQAGTTPLPAHAATVLLASDGLTPLDAGLAPEQIATYLRGSPTPAPLPDRLGALIDRARSAALGGGRDNLALVAIEPGETP